VIVPATLAQAVEVSAAQAPERGFRFITDERKGREVFHSFAEIERVTAGLAGAIQALGLVKGDRLALIVPDNDAFVLTFLAALRAGVVPVPVYPPVGLGQLSGYLDNTRHIVERSGARALVTSARIKPLLGAVYSSCPELRHIVSFSALLEASQPFSPVDVAPRDVAFLQYTSGSTSRPKGVVLTHANLLANSHSIIIEGLRADPERFAAFTWLPLYHDMGLIGFVVTLLVYGINVTFMSALDFLRRPAAWLRGISRTRADVSFAPNFAYALCVKRIRDEEIEGIDLSGWRFAGCGAEPIRAETLEAFASKFAPYGFRRESFLPAYGMAESTLAISFGKGIPVDSVRASVLSGENRAVPCQAGDNDCQRIVGCGKAFEGHQIAVFAPEDDRSLDPLPDRVVGEFRLRGPSVCQGYFEDPALSAASIAGGWLKTGDLGYLVDGEVYVCGRSKELIIVNGRNFYPQDIEWSAHRVEGVRKGNVIAFGARGPDPDREWVVLAFETSSTDTADRQRMMSEIRASVQGSIGVALDDVVPLPAGALPKTTSGKLQRTKTRQLYETGELARRRGSRDANPIEQVRQIAASQFEYLKLAVVGGKPGNR
jgi:fatty-acyl-CoA synthase